MSKVMHETGRIEHAGAVDADGHILEPPDLWETYLEPKYRDRALRIVLDENGLEELEIGGERVDDEPPRLPVDARRDGRSRPRARCSSTRTAPTSARRRSAAWTPTSASSCSTPRASTPSCSTRRSACCGRPSSRTPSCRQAYTRAYNRWICEFCSDSAAARARPRTCR